MTEFANHSDELSVVNANNPTPEVQAPLQRAIVIASFACFGSLIFSYWVARLAVEPLEAGWAGLVVYALLPISVTFIILYRSCWHREITGAARTCSLLLLSCVVLAGVLLATGFLVGVLSFCLMAISGGNH